MAAAKVCCSTSYAAREGRQRGWIGAKGLKAKGRGGPRPKQKQTTFRFLFQERTPARTPQGLRAVTRACVVQFERSDILVNKRVGSLSLRLETSDGLQDTSKSEEFEDEVAATVRIYTGEILQGAYKGTEVILKEYPYVPGVSFAELAKNEVRAHTRIKALEDEEGKESNVCSLLGTYAGRLGETWLVFSSDCIYPVSYWTELARKSNPAGGKKQQQGWSLLNWIDPDIEWHRRQAFVFTIVREALQGLATLHRANVLHCNVCPDSVVLSTVDEKQVGGKSNEKGMKKEQKKKKNTKPTPMACIQ